MNVYGNFGGMILTGPTKMLGVNPVPILFGLPKIPLGLAWASTEKGQ
jgi:hypothetical protein